MRTTTKLEERMIGKCGLVSWQSSVYSNQSCFGGLFGGEVNCEKCAVGSLSPADNPISNDREEIGFVSSRKS